VRNLYASLKIIRAGRNIKTLAISSVSANEGKTTTAALLGKSFSELGIKVLLIDADLRKTQLHETLGLDNVNGFSNLFAASDLRIDSLLNWVSPNLAVLTGGYRPPDPAALLSSERFSQIIAQIKSSRDFDLILVDTPPSLDLVDPILISRDLDGLLLLVTLGKTDKDLMAKTIRRIVAAQIDLIGVICRESVDSFATSNYTYAGYGLQTSLDHSTSDARPHYVTASVNKAKDLFSWLDKRR
jgi:succinoglycan biosynthesis transport protein ExoP